MASHRRGPRGNLGGLINSHTDRESPLLPLCCFVSRNPRQGPALASLRTFEEGTVINEGRWWIDGVL